MKPKRGVRNWESAAKVLMLRPLAGVAVLKVMGFALTWGETQEGVPIAFRGLPSRLLSWCLMWKPRKDSELDGIDFGSRLVDETE